MEYASPQIWFCHTPRQLCVRLRELGLAGPQVWFAGTEESYILTEWSLGSIAGFRAVQAIKRTPESYTPDTVEYYIVALWLPDGSTVSPSVLDGCGAWSGSGTLRVPFLDEPSVVAAQAEIAAYIAFRNVLFSTWTGATVGATAASETTLWGDRVSVQNYSTPWAGDASTGAYQERVCLHEDGHTIEEDRPPYVVVVDPPELGGSSASFSSVDPTIGSAIRELANRDVVFSNGNGGPWMSFFGRSTGS